MVLYVTVACIAGCVTADVCRPFQRTRRQVNILGPAQV